MFRLVLAALLVGGCGALEAPETALNCTDCVPSCAVGVDPDDFEGSARRLGCDPELVAHAYPGAGETIADLAPRVQVEFAHPPLWTEAPEGSGCNGPIQLRRVGRIGEVPGSVAADIVTRASITTLPVWPADRECVPGAWTLSGSTLSFVPDEPLEQLLWYEVVVVGDLPFRDRMLCSELSFRFATSGCGNGVIEQATSFLDWVCLGHVEAELGYFQPYSEQCDDGNLVFGDACTNYCVKQPGWSCDDAGCTTRCGDGIRAGDEACDDANTRGGDGCSADCSEVTSLGGDG